MTRKCCLWSYKVISVLLKLGRIKNSINLASLGYIDLCHIEH